MSEYKTNLSDEQMRKLPRYVQAELNRLLQDVNYYRRKLMEGSTGDTDTMASVGSGRLGLPRGTTIHFGEQGGPTADGFSVYYLDGELVIYGTRSVSVRPMSGNHVRMRVEP